MLSLYELILKVILNLHKFIKSNAVITIISSVLMKTIQTHVFRKQLFTRSVFGDNRVTKVFD